MFKTSFLLFFVFISTFVRSANFLNFNEPNTARIKEILKKGQSVRIIQFGDSHTAADFFTGEIRSKLQGQFGNGGLGWISPVQIPGNRYDNVLISSKNWKLSSVLNSKSNNVFPFGGFIAETKNGSVNISVKNKNQKGAYSIWLLYKNSSQTLIDIKDQSENKKIVLPSSKDWKFVKLESQYVLPISFSFSSRDFLNLGGIYIEGSSRNFGAVLSAVGINGATIYTLDKLGTNLNMPLVSLGADIVILAFGTNEANQASFNELEFKKTFTRIISGIRKTLPHAAIILISPPDSMRAGISGSCGSRLLISLKKVQRAVLDLAASQKLMFWDWSRAMGGDCSIARWKNEKLATNYIHLSSVGYTKSADIFLSDMFSALSF